MTETAVEHLPFVVDDGGRAAAGFTGTAGDCVARAIAIVAQLPYADVYAALAAGTGAQRRSRHQKGRRAASARNGISTKRKWFRDYMASLGFIWVPTMKIGQGCKVHLAPGELPAGRLVVAVSRHYTAVVDGVVRDTFDPQRYEPTVWYKPGATDSRNAVVSHTTEGRRCVYGYWVKGNV